MSKWCYKVKTSDYVLTSRIMLKANDWSSNSRIHNDPVTTGTAVHADFCQP